MLKSGDVFIYYSFHLKAEPLIPKEVSDLRSMLLSPTRRELAVILIPK